MAEMENSLTPRPDQTLLGVLVAGGVALLAYFLNRAIAEKLPVLTSQASLADTLTALIRTVNIAVTPGAVMVFGIIALGLMLLTVKYTLSYVQRVWMNRNS